LYSFLRHDVYDDFMPTKRFENRHDICLIALGALTTAAAKLRVLGELIKKASK